MSSIFNSSRLESSFRRAQDSVVKGPLENGIPEEVGAAGRRAPQGGRNLNYTS